MHIGYIETRQSLCFKCSKDIHSIEQINNLPDNFKNLSGYVTVKVIKIILSMIFIIIIYIFVYSSGSLLTFDGLKFSNLENNEVQSKMLLPGESSKILVEYMTISKSKFVDLLDISNNDFLNITNDKEIIVQTPKGRKVLNQKFHKALEKGFPDFKERVEF
jgi:hypothetical protein